MPSRIHAARPLTFGAAYRIKVDPSRPLQRDADTIIRILSHISKAASRWRKRQAIFFIEKDSFIYLEDDQPRSQVLKTFQGVEKMRQGQFDKGNEASALFLHDRAVRSLHNIYHDLQKPAGFLVCSKSNNPDEDPEWRKYNEKIQEFEKRIAAEAQDATIQEHPVTRAEFPQGFAKQSLWERFLNAWAKWLEYPEPTMPIYQITTDQSSQSTSPTPTD